MDFFYAGLLTGGVGDSLLQLGVRNHLFEAGLKDYFEEQGPLLAVIKASLLTGVWSGAYAAFFTPSLNTFVPYAMFLDLLYRYAHPVLYPSLAGYYNANSLGATLLYNAIVALFVFYVHEFIF